MKEIIKNVADIGRIIRQKRKVDRLTLADAAALCNVGYRFLSELENGKETAEIGKVLQVLHGLGLVMRLDERDLYDRQEAEDRYQAIIEIKNQKPPEYDDDLESEDIFDPGQ